MKNMRIALAQINAAVGDLPGNARRILEKAQEAKAAGADIVVFPELALTGYPPEDLLLKPQFVDDNVLTLRALSKKTPGIICVTGYVEKGPGRTFYNSAAVIHGGRVLGSYQKCQLPNYSVFDEKRYFAAGARLLTIDINGFRVGLTICEDIWVDKGPSYAYRPLNLDLLLNLSASPYYAGKINVRHELARRRVDESNAPMAYCNLVGGQDELVFDGGSFFMNRQGRLLASAPQFEESLLLLDVPTSLKKKTAAHGKVRTLRVLLKPSSEKRPLTRSLAPILGSIDEIHGALVLGTRDYVNKNGFSTVALGVSGGIDSALVAALAVEALGKNRVVAVTMPSRYTSSETLEDSQRMADNLGIRLITLPIEPAFKNFLGMLGDVFKGTQSGIAEENIQARIRGTLLMALSNKFGWLILTTGNKSETSTGYCTLYGDTAGGFAIIKDVPKTLVYELVRFVNQKHGREIIPHSIMTRPPTAELRAHQKDQDTLPPYPLLDKVIKGYVEEDKSVRDLIKSGLDETMVKKVVRMVDSSEYKRRQAPPGIKITPKAFGKDRRMPITNLYKP